MRPIFQTVIVGALFSAAFAAPALADSARQFNSVQVFVGDLDLSREAGQATLQARLMAAAKRVCHRAGDSTFSDRAERNACIDEAMDTALASLPIGRPYAQLGRLSR